MAKKVRQYSAAEKAKVVLTALQGDLTLAQISSQYGVHSTQINSWKKEAMESIVAGFQTKTGSPEPDQGALIRQLYEQIPNKANPSYSSPGKLYLLTNPLPF